METETMTEEKKRRLRRARLARSLSEAKGMTIVELMIVLTIIASIMGVVGFFVFGALDKASIQEARIEVKQLGNLVDAYYLSSSPRQLPDSLQDLAEGPSPLTKEVPKDPWGNDYIFKKSSNREYEIYSAGPDGSEGTEDDVRAEESSD
jgi:general secretion pathway protein G